LGREIDEFGGHEDGEGDVVQAFERVWESFVVSCEPSESRRPCEATFDDPSAWQEHEAALGHGVFDDLQPDAVLCGGFSGVGSGVALVHEGQLDGVAGHLLDLGSERGHLFAVPVIGRCNGQRQQVAKCIDRDVDLPLRRLAPS
jgi:hypothetical protein